MRASSPSPGARGGRSSQPTGGGGTAPVSWPALARKAGALLAQWSAAAADARRALGVADHVRARLPPMMLLAVQWPNDDDNPWSACGPHLRATGPEADALRARVVDAHLRDVEEELRSAAAARGAMAEAAAAMGRLAAAAGVGAAALSASAARALEAQLAPGPGPLAVAESVQDLWRACAAETQLHEAAAARCALPPAAVAAEGKNNRRRQHGGDANAASAGGWAAALAVLEAEVNVDRARFESFFDAVNQAWPA